MNKNISYMVFSPDAVEQKLVYPILYEMKEKHGIVTTGIKYLNVKLSHLEILYTDHIKKMTPNWWLVEKLFSMGTSVIVLLKKGSDNKFDLSKYLSKIKGKSDPSLCSEETIRGKFLAENRTVNLLHTPDDYESFNREIKVFLNEEECKRYNEQKSLRIELLIENNSTNTLLDFYLTLSRLKRRIFLLIMQDKPNYYHENEKLYDLLLEEMLFQKEQKKITKRITITKEYTHLLKRQKDYIINSADSHDLHPLLYQLILVPFSKTINIYDYYDKYKYKFGPFLSNWEMLTIQTAVARPIKLLFGDDSI